MSITSDRSNLTTGTEATEAEQATRAPETGRGRSRRALLGWGAVAAGCLAAGALAVATLSGGGDEPAPVVPAHPGIIENGSPRAIDGSVEDRATVSAGPGIAENGSPRAVDGTVEGQSAPTAEDTGSNVADMPPVAMRGTFAPSDATVSTDADEQPPTTPSPLVSRRDPPL